MADEMIPKGDMARCFATDNINIVKVKELLKSSVTSGLWDLGLLSSARFWIEMMSSVNISLYNDTKQRW